LLAPLDIDFTEKYLENMMYVECTYSVVFTYTKIFIDYHVVLFLWRFSGVAVTCFE
jgi:hypothetical protein